MNDYQIKTHNGRLVIFDADGEVDAKTARKIIKALRQSYPVKHWVYIGYHPAKKLYKVGITANVERRARQLGIEIRHTVECPDFSHAYDIEQVIHITLREYSIAPEWYDCKWGEFEFLEPYTDHFLAGGAVYSNYMIKLAKANPDKIEYYITLVEDHVRRLQEIADERD